MAQTTKHVQKLFDGNVSAGVPTPGWRSVSLFGFDRTHGNDTTVSGFRASWQTYEFGFNSVNSLHTRFTCPPDRLINSPVYYKWHYSTNEVTTGNVTLRLVITSADVGDAFGAGASSTIITPVDTQYEHYVTTFGPFHTTLEIDGTAMLRFDRVGNDAGDTYPDPIYHLDFQAWYQTDRVATPNYLSPYYS